MPGSRLTRRDRRAIATGLADGLGYAEIARNGGRADYEPDTAHGATQQRGHQRKPQHPQPVTVHAVERQLAATLVGTGLPRMSSRVLTALLTADDPGRTAAELSQHLRVSAASVPTSVGYLEGEGIVRRERIPQRRAERYVVDPDTWFQAILAARNATAGSPTPLAGRRRPRARHTSGRPAVRVGPVPPAADQRSDRAGQPLAARADRDSGGEPGRSNVQCGPIEAGKQVELRADLG